MAVVFAYSGKQNSYDINYVRNVHAAKQAHGTTVISTLSKGEEVPTDSVLISRAMGRSQNYYADFTRDYIEGKITTDEFYSHIEDLFYGMNYEGATPEEKQSNYEYITQLVYNGVLDYYLMKNANEWSSCAPEAQFYYNSNYHYEHLEQIPTLLEGIEKLANKLNIDSNLDRYNKNILTVNGRMAVLHGTKTGSVVSMDEVPPKDFKITLYTKYAPYSASVECDGQTHTASIPFSYDDLTYKFQLADLLSAFDIAAKYMAYINNISVVNEAIAFSYRGNGGTERTHGVSNEIFAQFKDFETIVGRAIAAYDANATEVVYENRFMNNENHAN